MIDRVGAVDGAADAVADLQVGPEGADGGAEREDGAGEVAAGEGAGRGMQLGHLVVGGVEGDGVGADEDLGWGGRGGRCGGDGEGAGGGLEDSGLD